MCCLSLSARRAWIEISYFQRRFSDRGIVALRKESVDRNGVCAKDITDKKQSLSARRAWIEIVSKSALMVLRASLSARRAWIEIQRNEQPRQQAERSLSARRAWIEIPPVHTWDQ